MSPLSSFSTTARSLLCSPPGSYSDVFHFLSFPLIARANLLAGRGLRSISPHHNARPTPHGPNHPLATGLIIAASVIVAAGIAIYESPQVRQWVDQSRRKIAVALHSLGDDIQPRRPSESSDDFDARQKTRQELIRRNRNDLIRRAREEGVAVDLDELAKIGAEDEEMAAKRSRADRTKSFDDMVGSNGILRGHGKATGTETSEGGARKRGVAGFAAGAAAAAAMSNPFSDDAILFDHHDDAEAEAEAEAEAPPPNPFDYAEPETRESTATIEGDFPSSPSPVATLIDLTPDSILEAKSKETAPAPAPAPPLEASETEQAAQSFYSFTSSVLHAQAAPTTHPFFDDEAEHVSAGTLTPRSDRSVETSASLVGAQADDIAILSMQNSFQNDTDHDARSEVFSEGGFTDAGFSEAGFSELGDRTGVMTPNSWTDVGSDDESEWGGAAHGHVSQVHQ